MAQVYLRMLAHRNQPRWIRLALAQHHMLGQGITPPVWHTRMVLREAIAQAESMLGVYHVSRDAIAA